MGSIMAANLIKAGHAVNVYNRTPQKAEPLAKLGATVMPSPKDVIENSDVTFLMLTNAGAIKAVLDGEDGVLAGVNQKRTIIDMSTIAPEESKEFARLVAERGGKYVDAPVSGSIGAAAAAGLIILAGALEQEIADVKPLFEALGKKVISFGSIGKGSAAKLVINLLLGITAQAIGETMLFAEKLGLDRKSVIELISNSGMNTPLFQIKKDMFHSQEFPSQFMLELMAKDLGLISDAIAGVGLQLPLAKIADATFAGARDNGKGKMDLAAIYLELKEKNSANA
jgi:3-hydroxyisobutyrate dehydrogenase